MPPNINKRPLGYLHSDEKKECEICGLKIKHLHKDLNKPRELDVAFVDWSPKEGEISPDGKASTMLVTPTKWWEALPYTDGIDFYDIPAILAEHTERIVAELEGMRLKDDGYDTMVKSSLIPIEPYSWNHALDEAIKRIKEI